MDGDDFDDLLGEIDLLQDSSQESLTTADANHHVLYGYPDYEDQVFSSQESRPTSVERDNAYCLGSHDAPAVDSLPSLSVDIANHDEDLESASFPDRLKLNVIGKIELIFEDMVDAMTNEKNELSISLKSRVKSSKTLLLPSAEDSVDVGVIRARRFCFPGKSAEEAWRFTVTTRILELVHEALQNDAVLSKRDIYYRDSALFGRQEVVNRYIDDIALTFDVPRSALNVTAVAKGLVAGAISFCRHDGSVVETANEREGILVPSLREILSVNMTAVKWILIVEKEATFRSIAVSSFGNTISARGVLLTGKGYPDVASRALVHFLSTCSLQNGFAAPPVYALVDFDPDGLAIYSVYKHGSLAMSHENADLHVPQMQLLGLRSQAMPTSGDDVHSCQGILPLTARDRNKAVKMLERCTSTQHDDNTDMDVWAALQTMLMLGTKAELQILDATPNGMTDLLTAKLGYL